MNAETPKAEDLSLPQAFLLLATNDKDGEPQLPAYVLRTTLAGAILAELDLLGAVAVQGKHVRATGAAPESDFQHELELIREKSRPHTAKRWVSMLEGRGEVRRVYEGMASLGIVEHVGEKHLGPFKSTRYPEKDHAPEAALLQKIQAALGVKPSDATPAGASAIPAGATPPDATPAGAMPPDARTTDATPAGAMPPDARTTALIALLQAAGLLGRLFPAADQNRASALVKNHWPSRAVEDELRMIRLGLAEAAT
ncbi:GPP34 family phosphoprotein [Arthrobacter sp. 24S4-2]|uniref:GOLPH3/VPS74 family protein n=1 Tax=Arthrobacter sp. 24S4-2 TaxID=2575374 RepID=UPI0010C78312|nr:GPP34 family phosphoprotein [Arthrobacter sp. 24S4-2]QCO99996.1 GPP34 family phosphoprotein [Arthrobacter sp. 24S4-2]